MPELLTADQVAAALQVSKTELYRRACRGEVPSYRFGRARRFVLAEVLAALRDPGPTHRPSARQALALGRALRVARPVEVR